MLARCTGSNLLRQLAGKDLIELTAERPKPRNLKQVLELRVPGLDAVFEVLGQDADPERLDDVFAEVLEALDLNGFLLERLVEARVFDGDGDVAGDGGEQLKVIAREVVAVDCLAESDDGDPVRSRKRQAMK